MVPRLSCLPDPPTGLLTPMIVVITVVLVVIMVIRGVPAVSIGAVLGGIATILSVVLAQRNPHSGID